MSIKSPLQAENSTFFLARTQTKKYTAQNAPKHAITNEKFVFFWEGHFLGRGIAPL